MTTLRITHKDIYFFIQFEKGGILRICFDFREMTFFGQTIEMGEYYRKKFCSQNEPHTAQ